MGPYWAIMDHKGPEGTIQDHTRPYCTIQDHTGPFRIEARFGPMSPYVCLFVCEFPIHRVAHTTKNSCFLFFPKIVFKIPQQPEDVLYSKGMQGYPLSPNVKTIAVSILRAE